MYLFGIALSAEGAIATADETGCSVHSLSGSVGSKPELLLRKVLGGVHSVCFAGNGDIVTCDEQEVCVFTPSGVLLRRFEHGVCKSVYCVRVACAVGQLYQLDPARKCVSVFD
jgi:hypothetical protein